MSRQVLTVCVLRTAAESCCFGMSRHRLQVPELDGLLIISSCQLTVYKGNYFACCCRREAEDSRLHGASSGFLLNRDIYTELMAALLQ